MNRRPLKWTFASFVVLSVLFVVFYSVVQRAGRKTDEAGTHRKAIERPQKDTADQAVKGRDQTAGTSEQAFKAFKGKEDVPGIPESAVQPDWLKEALALLKDPNMSKRVYAVRILRAHPSPEAVKLLSRFLYDESRGVVREALRGLGSMGRDEDLKGLVYQVLEERARDKSCPARGEALVTAAKVTEDNQILHLIQNYIAEEDDLGKQYAVRAMAFINSPECVPYLKQLLDQIEDPTIQHNSVGILARINTPESQALLEQYVLSADHKLQIETAWALSLMNDEGSNGVLENAIASQDLNEQAIATIAKSPAAPEVFQDLLQRGDIDKQEKLDWLEILGVSAGGAPSKEVRSRVAEVISSLLDSEDPDLELAAINALGNLAAGEEVAEKLSPKLDSDTFVIQEAALGAYVQYMNRENYKRIIDLWWDNDEAVRRNAFFFTDPFLDESDMKALGKAAEHPDKFISDYAKRVIRQIERARKFH